MSAKIPTGTILGAEHMDVLSSLTTALPEGCDATGKSKSQQHTRNVLTQKPKKVS